MSMTEEKIKLAVSALKQLKSDLKDIKKDIRQEEKINSPEYHDLFKAFSELKKQVKDFKDQWLKELREEEFYNKLRNMKVEKDEEIAAATVKLFEMFKDYPAFTPIDLTAETGEGIVRVQVMPEMRLYLNGKEEKK